MKTILMIIVLVSVLVHSQQYEPKLNTESSLGKYTMMKSSTGDTVLLLVYAVPSGVSNGTTAGTYGKVDTAATTSDSISTSFKTQYVDVGNTGSEIVYLCTDVSFGANKIPIPPGSAYRWSVSATRIHYKTTSGTSIIYIIAQ